MQPLRTVKLKIFGNNICLQYNESEACFNASDFFLYTFIDKRNC